jgi:hypothetical protein
MCPVLTFQYSIRLVLRSAVVGKAVHVLLSYGSVNNRQKCVFEHGQ